MRPPLRLLGPMLICAIGSPAIAPAQRLSVAPEIGVYIPTELLADAASGTAAELEAGPSFGLRLGVLLGDRVTLSFGGSYVPTTFALRPGGGQPEQRDARLFNGAGQLMLFVLPPTSVLSLFVNGGVGVVSRGGIAFTNESETTNVAGVFGGGAALRLGGVIVTAGADLYRYTAEYHGAAAVASELRQLDVQIRLGLGIGGFGPRSRSKPPPSLTERCCRGSSIRDSLAA